MAAVDSWLEASMYGSGALWVVLLVSLLLGLRHASDPDHLAAVSTLVASEKRKRVASAAFMGFSWGLGHGATLVVVGLPLVLFEKRLPESVQQAAEVAMGAIIAALAIRLLLKWRAGDYRADEHSHQGGTTHRHLYSRAKEGIPFVAGSSEVGSEVGPSREHSHRTPAKLRTPLSAFAVGLVHGLGGSGGLTLLLISTIPQPSEAAVALLIFASGTAISMSTLSTAFGWCMASGPMVKNFDRLAPVLGGLGAAFGAWYVLGALGAAAYPF